MDFTAKIKLINKLNARKTNTERNIQRVNTILPSNCKTLRIGGLNFVINKDIACLVLKILKSRNESSLIKTTRELKKEFKC